MAENILPDSDAGQDIIWGTDQESATIFEEIDANIEMQEEQQSELKIKKRRIKVLYKISTSLLIIVLIGAAIISIDLLLKSTPQDGVFYKQLSFMQKGDFYCNRMNGGIDAGFLDVTKCLPLPSLIDISKEKMKLLESDTGDEIGKLLAKLETSPLETAEWQLILRHSPENRIKYLEILENIQNYIADMEENFDTSIDCGGILFSGPAISFRCSITGEDYENVNVSRLKLSARMIALRFLDGFNGSSDDESGKLSDYTLKEYPQALSSTQISDSLGRTYTSTDVNIKLEYNFNISNP